jgi:catechol 2,3-dioxygenase-like lactoylglutathione lyase family enzyme
MAKLKHIAIATEEPEATARFYREVFDLQVVGKADSDDVEGYYLSDGNVSIAVLRFKNEAVAGESFGTVFSGIHHIGFQVEDPSDVDAKLKRANSHPMETANATQVSNSSRGHGGRNVALKYSGPDGVMIDVSQRGWVGADGD